MLTLTPDVMKLELKIPVWTLDLPKVASSVPGIIAIGVLGGGCEPPILGKRRL